MAWSIRYETHAMQTITKPLDVLIIGAGLSGVGTACHIAREFPNKTIALIERRKTLGGTWDLFRYPGIRSDSDMASFGYGFKPWLSSKVLADGPAIRDYVIETAKEFKLYEKTHFGLQTQTANWSSEDKLWTLVTRNEDSGEEQVFTCRYLISCTGYFNHDYGYRPEFPGEENFKGQIIHPQQWPEDLDYSNKRVVVIGSGATAVTLLPAMAEKVSHITMLQRSPSYVFALPNKDKVSDALGKFLPGSVVFKLAPFSARYIYPAAVGPMPCVNSCSRKLKSKLALILTCVISPQNTCLGMSVSAWYQTAICLRHYSAARPQLKLITSIALPKKAFC